MRGSGGSGYSECGVRGGRYSECGVRGGSECGSGESGYSDRGPGRSGYSECRVPGRADPGGRVDIVNAGSGESGYSDCGVMVRADIVNVGFPGRADIVNGVPWQSGVSGCPGRADIWICHPKAKYPLIKVLWFMREPIRGHGASGREKRRAGFQLLQREPYRGSVPVTA
ncbi:unnamed protein product, partial [Staurois parvus]